MRRFAVISALVLALAGKAMASGAAPETKPHKDLCLLDSNNCKGNYRYDIVEKIRRLNTALKLGLAVYTPEELEHLKRIKDETRDSFDFDSLYDEDLSENGK